MECGMRVLIIDDSIVMRKILEGALEQADLSLTEVLHAANGVEGLDAIEQASQSGETIDIILCDIHMPLMDGLHFLMERQRRQLLPQTPVVLITADPHDPLLQRAMAVGAETYISKPFTVEQIQSRVASLLLASSASTGR